MALVAGGGYINHNLKCLALEGRLVQLAFLQGSKAVINLAPLMMKRPYRQNSIDRLVQDWR